jgi:hypothetical protein
MYTVSWNRAFDGWIDSRVVRRSPSHGTDRSADDELAFHLAAQAKIGRPEVKEH